MNSEQLIEEDSFLWNFGCDSVKSLQLVSKLENWTGKNLPQAFEIIIYKTVKDLCNYLKSVSFNCGQILPAKRILTDDTVIPMEFKRIKKSFHIQKFRVVSKSNVLSSINESENHVITLKNYNIINLNIEWRWNFNKCIDGSPLLIEENK